MRCNVLQCVAMCCSVLQCVAVCCSVLQCCNVWHDSYCNALHQLAVFSRVTYMHTWCHICERVMSHMWMSHVTHMNESWHTCEWVVSHPWMSHVSYTNASCLCVTWIHHVTHTWTSHVTHMWTSHVTHRRSCNKKSCHTYLSALGKLMFERRAEVLTFFERIPTTTCVQNSWQNLYYQKTSFDPLCRPEFSKNVFCHTLFPEHPLGVSRIRFHV